MTGSAGLGSWLGIRNVGIYLSLVGTAKRVHCPGCGWMELDVNSSIQ